MKLRPWHKWVLAAAMAVAIFLSASDEGQQAESKQAHASVPQTLEPEQRPQPVPRVELERLGRPNAKVAADPAVRNTFSAISWPFRPPAPAPPPQAGSTAPPAPPMPFSYLGRYEEAGRLVIMLVRAERIYTVSEGEVIENTYRVERLTRGWLEMTYLPLNIKQTISTGET
jgi:hypothetical protein